MKKYIIFEKIGKFTFSIILTGILVTGVVLAATLPTWQEYDDADVVSGTEWQNMVNYIKSKASKTSLGNYYSKTESDNKYLTEVSIPAIVMDFNTLQGSAGLSHIVTKPTCSPGYFSKIQVNLDWYLTVGDVNDDDIIGTRIVDKGAYWHINGGDYDCGKFVGQKIIKGCGRYNTSRISYTSYCISVPKTAPVCGSTSGTCATGVASGVSRGVWTCTEGSIKKSCGSYEDPCDGSRPPRYCDSGQIER